MQIQDYLAFTERLKKAIEADSRVKGLVLLGSTANTKRSPDEWSDHDFSSLLTLPKSRCARGGLLRVHFSASIAYGAADRTCPVPTKPSCRDAARCVRGPK